MFLLRFALSHGLQGPHPERCLGRQLHCGCLWSLFPGRFRFREFGSNTRPSLGSDTLPLLKNRLPLVRVHRGCTRNSGHFQCWLPGRFVCLGGYGRLCADRFPLFLDRFTLFSELFFLQLDHLFYVVERPSSLQSNKDGGPCNTEKKLSHIIMHYSI